MDGRTDKWIKRKEGRGETKEGGREGRKVFPSKCSLSLRRTSKGSSEG